MKNWSILLYMWLMWSCVASVSAREFPRHRKYSLCAVSLEEMKGHIVVPVIFVHFEQKNNDNENAISAENQEAWMKRLNESCAANHMGDQGSVSDYFEAQSYGETHVSFERVGEYTASGKAADYVATQRSAQLVRQAVISLKETDWKRYDRNGDQEVDCVLLIFAGHSDGDLTQSKLEVKSIYPHHSWLSKSQGSKATVEGGLKVDNYVFGQDLRDLSAHVGAINTLCHELSHGIFDLCDYYFDLKSHLGQWDVMCYGFRQTNYSSADNHCCDMTAFNRMYLGWLTPTELTENGHYTLRPLSQHAEAYAISDPADEDHFFLLENRQRLSKTWDYHLPASGLILTEIRFNRSSFEGHAVNRGSLPHIQVIDAATGKGLCIPNETYLNVSQKTVPYGIDGHTEITETVSPLFATQRITNIQRESDGSMSFDYECIADALTETKAASNDESCYDLQGRKVKTPTRGGLYIYKNRIIKK